MAMAAATSTSTCGLLLPPSHTRTSSSSSICFPLPFRTNRLLLSSSPSIRSERRTHEGVHSGLGLRRNRNDALKRASSFFGELVTQSFSCRITARLVVALAVVVPQGEAVQVFLDLSPELS